MAYDADLGDRIRQVIADEEGLTEKRMFGGLAFLINGNMAVGVSGRGGVMLRCDPASSAEHVSPPHVERMVMRGREMDGWLRVEADPLEDDATLERWVTLGIAYARTLPPKS